jgi:hypothetical protein
MLGRPAISTAAEAAIRKALKKGDVGIRKIATTLGVGTGTVQRIKGGDGGVKGPAQGLKAGHFSVALSRPIWTDRGQGTPAN